MFESTQTVAEIATSHPEAVRVFQKLGIDFCCGGRMPLAQACEKKGLSVDETLAALEAEAARQGEIPELPTDGRLEDLVNRILETHHVFTRQEMERLRPLMAKVASVHGDRHQELARARALFEALCADLESHLMKEEQILFPHVVAAERAREGSGDAPGSCFGTVHSPITVMEMEHERAGAILAELRALTNGYVAPDDACNSYRALYHGLAELEADLHRHIHLENNVLFPRAIEMERQHAAV